MTRRPIAGCHAEARGAAPRGAEARGAAQRPAARRGEAQRYLRRGGACIVPATMEASSEEGTVDLVMAP